MKTSANGRKLIEGFEGLILQTYDDHSDHIVKPGEPVIGTLTIGYGHTGPDVHIGQVITKAQADAFLSADLAGAEKDVSTLVKVPINQNQFDALVSFQFNTGALARSSALTLLNAKNYTGAADHLTLYNEAAGHIMQGLVRRRAAEKALFLTPVTANVVVPVATVTTAAVGTVAATHASPSHFWYILGGVLVIGVIIDLLVHWYNNRKVTNAQ